MTWTIIHSLKLLLKCFLLSHDHGYWHSYKLLSLSLQSFSDGCGYTEQEILVTLHRETLVRSRWWRFEHHVMSSPVNHKSHYSVSQWHFHLRANRCNETTSNSETTGFLLWFGYAESFSFSVQELCNPIRALQSHFWHYEFQERQAKLTTDTHIHMLSHTQWTKSPFPLSCKWKLHLANGRLAQRCDLWQFVVLPGRRDAAELRPTQINIHAPLTTDLS